LKRLTDDGYQVTVATDVAIALGLVRQTPPGIIFVHIGHAGSGSIPFIVALRAGDDTRHIPVAVLTSYYNPRLERMGLTAVGQEFW
jgi:CheY-like chemotaxis protein